MSRKTHSIAVGAHIIDTQGRMLLLFRNTTPNVWALPGGRLWEGEEPLQGLQREVREECGLEVEPLCPTLVQSGIHKEEFLVAIFFLCRVVGGDFALSEEHSSARWFTLDELCDYFKTHSDIWGTLSEYKEVFLLSEILWKNELRDSHHAQGMSDS